MKGKDQTASGSNPSTPSYTTDGQKNSTRRCLSLNSMIQKMTMTLTTRTNQLLANTMMMKMMTLVLLSEDNTGLLILKMT